MKEVPISNGKNIKEEDMKKGQYKVINHPKQNK